MKTDALPVNKNTSEDVAMKPYAPYELIQKIPGVIEEIDTSVKSYNKVTEEQFRNKCKDADRAVSLALKLFEKL